MASLVSPSQSTDSSAPVIIQVGAALTVSVTFLLAPGTGPLVSGNVDFEIYSVSPSGQEKKVNQQNQQTTFSSASLSQSTQTFSFNWTPSSAGEYVVKLGVFDGLWTNNYHWNGSALGFTVTK